ncbi:MAG: SirB1 family protein [Thermoplasmata archaeon]
MGLYEAMRGVLAKEPLNLVRAATLLGRLGTSPHDAKRVRAQLERMGAELRNRLHRGPAGKDRLALLNRYLFEELGFRGNAEDFYDPRNSFLGAVLERKTGLPITLSLVYVEVGRRAGLPLEGVGFPGHFLMRYDDADGPVFVDPFHAGRVLEEQDLRALLDEMSEQPVPLDPTLLRPATEREILARMLHNLKGLYLTSEEFEELLQVMDFLLLLDPESPLDLRDRGLLHYERGDFRKARDDLRAYLEREPTAGDAGIIRAHLDDIESRLRMFR